MAVESILSFFRNKSDKSLKTHATAIKDEITLWGAPVSPFVRKVRIVLARKGIPYKYTADNQVLPVAVLRHAGKKESELPAILFEASPRGRVPVLEIVGSDGKRFVTDESQVIIAYLEDRFPNTPSVYPGTTPEQNARARWWQNWVDERLEKATNALLRENLVKPGVYNEPSDESAAESARKELATFLKFADEQLKDGRKWLAGGSELSVGDIAFAAQYANHEVAKWNVDLLMYPRLDAYQKNLMVQPCVKAVL